MSLLQLHEISKIFGGLIAINELSFSVEQGSVVGLIGPNGAGKTTVFNCITGNYKPEHGRITFGGQDITGKRPHNIVEMGIARTFQSIRLFGKLPALENVLAGRHCRLKSGFLSSMLHTPWQRREEKAAVERCMKNWSSRAWPTITPRPPAVFPTATSACWKSPAPWPPTPGC